MTIHSGDEQTIWEGTSRNVTARATGGRFTLHYRLTTHYLYYEKGGIGATRSEQVPLINVGDVDVNQSLMQRTQKVGNVLVHITRPNGVQETAVLDSIVEPEQVRDLINQTVHHVRRAAHERQIAEQTHLGVNRIQYQPPAGQQPPLPYGAPGGPAAPGMTPGMPLMPAAPPAPPQPALEATPAVQATTPEQVMALLKQLGELRDAGVVTPEEFEAKKKDLLDRL